MSLEVVPIKQSSHLNRSLSLSLSSSFPPPQEVLYEPLREIGARYPAWLAQHGPSLPRDECARCDTIQLCYRLAAPRRPRGLGKKREGIEIDDNDQASDLH